MMLSENTGAIELLKENSNIIDWTLFSRNPYAIDMLKQNQLESYFTLS
jgi:hypothetical protein